MRLEEFFTEEAGRIRFTREQASHFAKRVAGDFNPIHDPDAKRFCVPGDLLFAVVLTLSGLQQRMRFRFSGMVDDADELMIETTSADARSLVDGDGKTYLDVECAGERCDDAEATRALICEYVSFSGKTFPHILVPLMKEQGVMINPARPLIIYESMEIDLATCDLSDPRLELSDTELEVNGRRGTARLSFRVLSSGDEVGQGAKRFALGGLQPWDQAKMDAVVEEYNERKARYAESA
ncbi:MAG TPA: DUF3581 family protein [Gammaproteobacteria bacterium]|nr:DUF3581 family protein [Gammaproteobacteria bacterium]